MKQIKCGKCAKIWYVEDINVRKSVACPFCSKEIREEVKITETDTLGKVIYYAISDKGIGFLSSVGKITGFMLDVVQKEELKREVKIFSKTFNEDYLNMYREAFDMEIEEAEGTIKKLECIFTEEEGLSEEWTRMLCEDCLAAIKYYKGTGIEYVVSAEITDFSMEPNSTSGVKHKNKKMAEDYRKMAEEGDAVAMYELGNCYFEGTGGVTIDGEKAFECYMEAVKQGNVDALYRLGRCYSWGRGVGQSNVNAIKWFKKAAEQGNANAQYEVGKFYFYGLGVKKNVQTAIEWFTKAKEQRNPEAQYFLVTM